MPELFRENLLRVSEGNLWRNLSENYLKKSLEKNTGGLFRGCSAKYLKYIFEKSFQEILEESTVFSGEGFENISEMLLDKFVEKSLKRLLEKFLRESLDKFIQEPFLRNSLEQL